MTTKTMHFRDATQWRHWRALPGQVFRSFVDVLVRWQQRFEDRHYLSRMNDDMLRDIGVGRAELEQELQKPFWRP